MDQTEKTSASDVLTFLCELAMLALLVAAGHGLAPGFPGWLIGVILACFVIMIWSQWMAPRSPKRLPNPTRFFVQVALFITTALYAAAGGLLWWGVGFAVVAIGVFAALLRD